MSVATECVAGRCTACRRLVWRTATAQRDNGRRIKAGMTTILWPDPTSVYARLETDDGVAVGVAFCADCAPAPGDTVLAGYGPVVGLDTAHERYADWFTERYGTFRRAWLRDAFSLEPGQVDALMKQWQEDRG